MVQYILDVYLNLQIVEAIGLIQKDKKNLKSVNFELIWFCETSFGQPLANVFSLISLQLQNFSVFGMLNDSSVASEFLINYNHC